MARERPHDDRRVGLLYVIGRWDIAGYFLRYWLYGIYLTAALLSVIRVYRLPFTTPGDWTLHWSTAADLLVLAGNHIWIRSDSLFIVLAHLKHESIRVEPGTVVARG